MREVITYEMLSFSGDKNLIGKTSGQECMSVRDLTLRGRSNRFKIVHEGFYDDRKETTGIMLLNEEPRKEVRGGEGKDNYTALYTKKKRKDEGVI